MRVTTWDYPVQAGNSREDGLFPLILTAARVNVANDNERAEFGRI